MRDATVVAFLRALINQESCLAWLASNPIDLSAFIVSEDWFVAVMAGFHDIENKVL